VLAQEWVDNPAGELTEVERSLMKRTLELEIDNTTFYRSAMAKADSVDGQMLFKALSRVEAEHASTVSKILGVPKPDWEKLTATAFDTHQENVRDSLRRENRAVDFYKSALGQAQDARLKEIFSALIEIESDHIALATERIQ
jgi:rubrerythrin